MKQWKCTVCGYIHKGDEPPETCPVCGADKSKFIEVTGEKGEAAGETGQAQDSKEEKKPLGEDRKWKCTVCGYIHTGPEPPEKCPVCGADKSKFIDITDIDDQEKKQETKTAQPVFDAPKNRKEAIMGLMENLIVKKHLHPISVHSPNGIIPVAVIFFILGYFFQVKPLAQAGFFNMIAVLISMPAVLYTGYIAWQKKYNGTKTSIFITKITCAAIVTILVLADVIWLFIRPDVVFTSMIFLIINLVMLGAAGIAGHLGGKLVFKE